jgi:hypothetical protein
MSLKIELHTIPQRYQLYNTIGYWNGHEQCRLILVSEMGNSDYEFLVFLHELIEQALCLKRGISDESVTKFDMEFKGEGEPGDDLAAPYHREHVFASAIEDSVCKELGINPDEYEAFLAKYYEEKVE